MSDNGICAGCGKPLHGVGSEHQIGCKKYHHHCWLDVVDGPGAGARFLEGCRKSRVVA